MAGFPAVSATAFTDKSKLDEVILAPGSRLEPVVAGVHNQWWIHQAGVSAC